MKIDLVLCGLKEPNRVVSSEVQPQGGGDWEHEGDYYDMVEVGAHGTSVSAQQLRFYGSLFYEAVSGFGMCTGSWIEGWLRSVVPINLI